ncbi:MAG: thioredoxin family protein [Prolixibacteraceae bacterium]|jgi:peroxiredoxin|nr:thioredoxin family protein [Prolixibacteraceae bacterium]
MVHTFSSNLPMGIKAPKFELLNVISDELNTLDQLQSELATVIMFICNHCPYVKHINKGIAKLANDYLSKGISFIAISSNDADAFPDDSPKALKEQAELNDFNFPYLYDETQQIAKAYKAACTPDFFVFDGDLKLIYHGQIDDSSPKNVEPNNGKDIRNILDAKIKGQPFTLKQIPSSGCNIKWKAGVSPF